MKKKTFKKCYFSKKKKEINLEEVKSKKKTKKNVFSFFECFVLFRTRSFENN